MVNDPPEAVYIPVGIKPSFSEKKSKTITDRAHRTSAYFLCIELNTKEATVVYFIHRKKKYIILFVFPKWQLSTNEVIFDSLNDNFLHGWSSVFLYWNDHSNIT